MTTIKAIEDRTVHQIQSGQVIVDLCSVVKELVENSLDAGATSIDVRFKNQGLDSIEVQDNGDGISSRNYETIALKHYTSKLATYEDLTTLRTFGFRGEALSSLCALSSFSITTCVAADAPKGTKLEFEISGKLKGTSVVAAQKGTTVMVENLFNNLPVRRRELERNIKREYNRVVSVLGQYACIQTGIKFSVSQQPTKGRKMTLFSTKGNQTTRENIVNVFGAKTLAALITMDLKLELDATNTPGQRRSTQENGVTNNIRIIGHISRPASGEGRQTPDRQMFFVNSRPCGLPQVSKAFNEVYKSYNGTQSPFIFANIELDTHLYDVNVSPDKRTILLHDQSRMLETLKTELTALFESQDYTVPVSQLPALKQPTYKQLTISRESTASQTLQSPAHEQRNGSQSEDESSSSTRSASIVEDKLRYPDDASRSTARVSRDSTSRDCEAVSLISNWAGRKSENRVEPHAQPLANGTSEQPDNPNSTPQDPVEPQAPIPAIQSPSRLSSTVLNTFSSSRNSRPSPAVATITIGDDHTVTSSIGTPCPKRLRKDDSPTSYEPRSKAPGKPLPSFGNRLNQRFAAPGSTQSSIPLQDEDDDTDTDAQVEDTSEGQGNSAQGEESEEEVARPQQLPSLVRENDAESSLLNPDVVEDENDVDDEYIDEDEKKAREDIKVQMMIEAAELTAAQPSEENAERAKSLLRGTSTKKDSTLNLVCMLETDVSNISAQLSSLETSLTSYGQTSSMDVEESLESEEPEERLSLTISKSDFAKMKIIGQFNLGFILASRSPEPGTESAATGGDELFIIDQHASDEKYNFERLQSTTIVQSQPLVNPKILDLTAVEEEIVIENLTALSTNGFVVKVDQSGDVPVGERCQLISLPTSRETTFSLTDLDELLALLVENSGGPVPRPSKVRKMFAMRACRSSIMIGRTLTKRQMVKVVGHLGELDKPWNCPHGRPTMRHLCGLGVWDELGWKEDFGPADEDATGKTDWVAYTRAARRSNSSPSSS